MNDASTDIAIIGAGPYGLSLAAHLRGSGREFRIFGEPMGFWANHMPRGMCLKSEGFASSLYDPDSEFTLKAFCQEKRIPYADVGLPVRLEVFIDYAREFQQRYVPQLEQVDVVNLACCDGGFRLTTTAGEVLGATRVVVATGIKHYAYLPPEAQGVAEGMISHSSEHSNLGGFAGKQVVVLGGGASAFDMADLLTRVGASVQIVTRRSRIEYNEPPVDNRSMLARLKAPRSGLGTGWRSRMCTDMPLVFHALPQGVRLRAVRRHLGPSPCWFVKDAIAGRVTVHVGAGIDAADIRGSSVHLVLTLGSQQQRHIEADHLIAATGYRVALSRLTFIGTALRGRIRTVQDTPILNRSFECSVPELYFVGATAANSFGPLLRFAYGARFAARRIAQQFMAASRKGSHPVEDRLLHKSIS